MYAYANRAPVHLRMCREDAIQNKNDSVSVITVILPAVITEPTSILFAFKSHICTHSSTGVSKIWQSGTHEKEGKTVSLKQQCENLWRELLLWRQSPVQRWHAVARNRGWETSYMDPDVFRSFVRRWDDALWFNCAIWPQTKDSCQWQTVWAAFVLS